MTPIRVLPLLLLLALATACGPTTSKDETLPDDPETATDVAIAGDSPEAGSILELLNDDGTTLELLDATVSLDVRAAKNLIAHRDGGDELAGTADDDRYGSIEEVDAISFVGPVTIEKLRVYVENEGWLQLQSGVWESVSFNGAQVSIALDLAANASVEELDVDAGLDARAAENITAARPTSMAKLAALPYVGTSALEKIRGYLPTWQENGMQLEVYDGVSFTHQEAAGALAAANDANLDALSSVGIYGSPANILIQGRTWTSLSLVSSKAGIGPLTMKRLRTLSEAYAGVDPYVVSAADAPLFAQSAKNALQAEAGWFGAMNLLLADVSGSQSFVDGRVAAILAKIADRTDGFAASEIGRSYSSRSAAQDAFIAYARGLQLAARTDYPDGVLTLLPAMTQPQRLGRAKEGMLTYWSTTFVPGAQFQMTFAKSWNDVKGPVGSGIAAFESGSGYEVHTSGNETIFAGGVWGLYTEANVDPVGKVTRVFVEID